MTQSVTEHILAVGRNVLQLPADAKPLGLVSLWGAAHLCVEGDATDSGTVERVVVLVKSGDLLPDPQGVFIGSAVVAGAAYHCFDVTEAV